MIPAQKQLLEQAKEDIAAIEILLENEHLRLALSCCYYVMFYCASALLLNEKLAFSKHSAVIAAFGQYYSKAQKAPVHLHAYFKEAEESRINSDYGSSWTGYNEETVQIQLARAKEFLAFNRAVF